MEPIDEPCGHPCASLAEADVDPAAVDAVLERARREVDDGLLPSCQVAIARHGRLVAARTFGAPPTDRYVVFSCTKVIVAAAMWQVLGEGLVGRDTRVADVVPGFGANGKQDVTVEQLLTHTSGFPHAPMPIDEWVDPQRRLERFGSWPLDWPPGSRFTYHGTAAHWALVEVLSTVTGEDHRDRIRDRLLVPLGLPELQLGTPVADQRDVRDVVGVGVEPAAELLASVGLDASAIGSDEPSLLLHNDPLVRAVGQPGGGAIGRAADLALLHQALLADPDGRWDPAVLRAGTAEVLCALTDPMTGAPANRTLGLVLAGDDGLAIMRGFGTTCSPASFGHMGAGGQVSWADPATGLSFAYVTDGLDRDPLRMGTRGLELSTLAGGAATGSAP